MIFLALDPGADTGWASFTPDGTLIACGLGRPDVRPARVIIERPHVYPARLLKGDPNGLITLAIRVGRLEEHFEARGACVDEVEPATWKGQIPKDVHHRRVEGSLTPDERAVITAARVAASKRHNVLDAVALGKWAFASSLWAR